MYGLHSGDAVRLRDHVPPLVAALHAPYRERPADLGRQRKVLVTADQHEGVGRRGLPEITLAAGRRDQCSPVGRLEFGVQPVVGRVEALVEAVDRGLARLHPMADVLLNALLLGDRVDEVEGVPAEAWP